MTEGHPFTRTACWPSFARYSTSRSQREWLKFKPCDQVERPSKEHARDSVLSPTKRSGSYGTRLKTSNRRFEPRFACDCSPPSVGARFSACDGPNRSRCWLVDDPRLSSRRTVYHIVCLERTGRQHAGAISRRGRLKDCVEVNKWACKEEHGGRRRRANGYFHPVAHEGECLEWTRKATKRIREASGVEFRPHDLRRTAASLMTGSGTPRDVVKKILNHKEPGHRPPSMTDTLRRREAQGTDQMGPTVGAHPEREAKRSRGAVPREASSLSMVSVNPVHRPSGRSTDAHGAVCQPA